MTGLTDAVTRDVRSRLSDFRFYHSQCVAAAAKALAARYGWNEADAFLAGMAHDILKEQPRAEALCYFEENGVALVLVKSPSIYPVWHAEWDAEIAAFAKSRGLRYDNMIAENDLIGVDMNTDTYDQGQHLNVFGAEKLSRWFGAILQSEYGLKDHRGEAAYDADYAALTERYENEKQRLSEGN